MVFRVLGEGGKFSVSEKRWGSGTYGLSECFIGGASVRKLARVVQKHGEFGEHYASGLGVPRSFMLDMSGGSLCTQCLSLSLLCTSLWHTTH